MNVHREVDVKLLEGGTEVPRLANDDPRSFRVDRMWALLHLDVRRRADEGVVQLGGKVQRAVDERRHRAPEIRIGRRHHDLVVRGLAGTATRRVFPSKPTGFLNTLST